MRGYLTIFQHEKEKVFSVIKYVSWAGSTSELGGQIFMDVPVAAAKCLGLEDGDLCRVWPVFLPVRQAGVTFHPCKKKRRLGRCFRAKRTSGRVFVETTKWCLRRNEVCVFPKRQGGRETNRVEMHKVEA